jgi:hypothetical protein
VKLHETAVKALPALSVIPVASETVYAVLFASAGDGVKVAIVPLPLKEISPVTPLSIEKVPVVIVPVSIVSEKVTLTVPFMSAPVASADGLLRVTVGAVVSTVILTAVEAELGFPAESVAVAVRLCAPSDKAVAGVMLQLPSASVVAVPSEVESANSSTVLAASAVPLTSGVLSVVVVPPAGELITGALGAVASMVKLMDPESKLVFPARSVAFATRL